MDPTWDYSIYSTADRGAYYQPTPTGYWYTQGQWPSRSQASLSRGGHSGTNPVQESPVTDAESSRVIEENFTYRVKIINPAKKSDFVIREIHSCHERFESLSSLRKIIVDEFEDHVPTTPDFQIGYYLGKQSAKYWLTNQADLHSMYTSMEKGKKGNVLLWCDGNQADVLGDASPPSSRSRKRKCSPEVPVNKRKQTESEVGEIVSELKEKHASKYSLPQLRLWARMIISGNHESIDDPPRIPAIVGVESKKQKKESLADVIAGAAVSFANAFRSQEIKQSNIGSTNPIMITSTDSNTPTKPTAGSHTSSSRPLGLSPGKVAELRMKKLQELRELQQLYEQSTLNEEEFIEQKSLVLDSLRKLTH